MENTNDDDQIKKLSPEMQGIPGSSRWSQIDQNATLRSDFDRRKIGQTIRQLSGIQTFVNIPVKVTPRRSLNSCKKGYQTPSLKYVTEKEILHGMRDLHVTEVHKIKSWKNGLLQSTNTFSLAYTQPT